MAVPRSRIRLYELDATNVPVIRYPGRHTPAGIDARLGAPAAYGACRRGGLLSSDGL